MMELSLGFPLPCAGGFPQERGQAFLRLLQKQFLQAGGQVPGHHCAEDGPISAELGAAQLCRSPALPESGRGAAGRGVLTPRESSALLRRDGAAAGGSFRQLRDFRGEVWLECDIGSQCGLICAGENPVPCVGWGG